MSGPIDPNPYESAPSFGPHSDDARLDGIEPNISTPKTFGTLNIVFASLLLLCIGCYGIQIAAQSMMAPMMAAEQQKMQDQIEAERAEEIAELDAQEAAAETDEERQAIDEQRQLIKQRPVPQMPDMSKFWGTNKPVIFGYFVADLGTGFLLNLLMLIAGIGLLGLKSWARALSVWVAAIKIFRLIVLCVVTVLVVAPVFSANLAEWFEELMAQAPQGPGQQPDAQQIAKVYGIMISGWGVAMMIFGAIYPAIALWCLTRPDVKAGCRPVPDTH